MRQVLCQYGSSLARPSYVKVEREPASGVGHVALTGRQLWAQRARVSARILGRHLRQLGVGLTGGCAAELGVSCVGCGVAAARTREAVLAGGSEVGGGSGALAGPPCGRALPQGAARARGGAAVLACSMREARQGDEGRLCCKGTAHQRAGGARAEARASRAHKALALRSSRPRPADSSDRCPARAHPPAGAPGKRGEGMCTTW